MAEMAQIVPITAVEADGNDVELGRIVFALGVVIDRFNDYLGASSLSYPFVRGAPQIPGEMAASST